MNRGRILLIAVAMVMLSSVSTWAASARCVVVEVEEKRLVLECERGTEGISVDQDVKIKTERGGAQVEGC